MPKAQLLELYARGLGVIDETRLEFGPGFNVITGETGAGKTLLLGALALCLGGDVSSSRYAISTDTRAVALFLATSGEELAFSRETTATGRLRSSINGAPSSAEALRHLAEELIVIHGQHDSLALRNRSEIVRLIDQRGAIDTSELDDLRRQVREARRILEDYGGDKDSRRREFDFLVFQLNELDSAAIVSEHELRDTLDELVRLTSLRDGQAAIAESLELFDNDGDDSALARYAHALATLPEGAAYDGVRSTLRASLVQARDALHDLAALADPDVFDPKTLEELNRRADALQLIARKYGGSLSAALAMGEELRETHDRLLNEVARLDGLDQEILNLETKVTAVAARVRAERERAAAALSDAVQGQLRRVALEHASLRFVVSGEDGADAQLLFAPNPGLPEGPLSAVASGGELSRVLLAISLESADADVVAVFDEVDAGVGGQVAQQIGECLFEVGRHQQVLAVTHLASVAARADHHFLIEKSVVNGVTTTSVRALEGEDRVREIARMLAGDEVTSESRALAQQLLKN
jgi:DNA repair protein RecN (Recombination protein N)